MKHTLYLSQLLVSCTIAELSKIHILLWSIYRSMQCVWYIMAGDRFISSYPRPTLLEQEPHILTYSLRIAWKLHRFTTRWLSELRNALWGCDSASLDVLIEWVWRYTWRLWLREFGGRSRARLEIHLEAVIEWVWRFTWRPWSMQFGHALRGYNDASLEMYWEAVIEQVWRCTWRPWSSEIGDPLRGRHRAYLEIHLEAVIEWT
jgi:hypothetical protein